MPIAPSKLAVRPGTITTLHRPRQNVAPATTREIPRTTLDASKRKGKPPAPEGETKDQKFKRLATARMGEALKRISLLGNLAGSNYEYTDAQIDAMKVRLDDEVSRAITALYARGRKSSVKDFTF